MGSSQKERDDNSAEKAVYKNVHSRLVAAGAIRRCNGKYVKSGHGLQCGTCGHSSIHAQLGDQCDCHQVKEKGFLGSWHCATDPVMTGIQLGY